MGGGGKKSYSFSVVSGRRRRKGEREGERVNCASGVKRTRGKGREEFGIGAAGGGVSSTQINAQE